MYTVERVMQGLSNYIDAEVMDKLPSSGRFVMGTVMGMANGKAHTVVEQLKENPVVSMLGIVDESDHIDAEALIEAMRTSADKYGSIMLEVPLVGRLTFTSTDIDHLRSYIV